MRPGPSLTYDGKPRDLFKIYLQNVLLTLLTLGVYRFWAKVRMRKFRYQHTEFVDGRFDYHATGREKFVGFLKGLVILILPMTGAAWIIHSALEPTVGSEDATTLAFYGVLLLIFFLRPVIIVGSERFNLSRTSWNNLRFRFTGRIGELYRIYLTDAVLMVLTLGIYTAWHNCNVRRYRMEHTTLGDTRFDYKGTGGELFGLMFFGSALTMLTFGLFVPWYIARLHRFHVDNTYYENRRFKTTLTGGNVAVVGVISIVTVVLSLGLMFPWAMTLWARMTTNTTSYTGTIDVDALVSSYDEKASAFGEGLGEAGEAIGEIGDLLGG